MSTRERLLSRAPDGLALWLSAAGILFVASGRIDPPWPERAAIPMAAAFSASAFALASRWRASLSARTQSRLGASILLGALVVTLGYAYAYGRFVVRQTKLIGDVQAGESLRADDVRVVVGLELRADMPPDLPPRELLLRYGFDPERVWTSPSILAARLALASGFWLLAFLFPLGARLLIARGEGKRGPPLRILHVWADPLLLPATASAVQVGGLRIALEPFSQLIDYQDQPACSRQDLLSRLNWFRPHILQISGHGDPDGGILLMHPESGKPSALSKSELATLLRGRPELQVLVMDCCYGLIEVEAFRGVVDAVIGVRGQIEEPYPILFSAALYDSIANGRSLEDSVRYAAVATGTEGGSEFELWTGSERTPTLRV